MKSSLLLTFALLLTSSLAATPLTFDFKDPKGVNAITFKLDSLLEPIAGTASAVTGTVSYDPAAPDATTGRIVVAASSLVVPNNTMRQHLLSSDWIDAEAHPEIIFNIAALENIQTNDNTVSATARGSFSLRGVTQEITVPVTLTHLKGVYGQRLNRPQLGGDLLVVRGAFDLARADYGIKPGQNEDKVAPIINLSFAVVGGAPDA